MGYYSAYPYQNQYCQCEQQQVYVQRSSTNKSGIIILAAALLLLPLFGWGMGGFYY